MRLHSSGVLEDISSTYQQQIEQWSVGECLDATEMAWSIGLRYPDRKKDVLEVLSQLQKHSPLCKEWGRLSRVSLQHKLPRAILKNVTEYSGRQRGCVGCLTTGVYPTESKQTSSSQGEGIFAIVTAGVGNDHLDRICCGDFTYGLIRQIQSL